MRHPPRVGIAVPSSPAVADAIATVRRIGLAVWMTGCGVLGLAASADMAAPSPRLDPIRLEPTVVSFAARGVDPGAPRALELWLEQGGRTVRVGRTHSTSDGRFDFGEQVAPIGAIAYRVVPVGAPLEAAPASLVERRLPPPLVSPLDHEGHAWSIVPALSRGEIRVWDLRSRRLLLRRSIGDEGRGRLEIDLEAEGIDSPKGRQGHAPGGLLAIEHWLPDGRRSPVRRLPRPNAAPLAPATE